MANRFRGSAEERLALDTFVKLMRAADAVARRLSEGLAGEDVSHAQLAVLEALLFVGPMCQVDLGRKLLRSASNVTGVIDGLERKGWVERTRREADRRVVDVALTPSGRAAIEQVFPRHARNVAAAFVGLRPDEQAALGRLSKQLGRSLSGDAGGQMSDRNRLVLVTGATGSQGGAVARELLAKGWKVRAMTRKPDSDKARALAAKGAEVVQGDLDDPSSVARALQGVWGVWAVQNTWEAGVEREEQQGHALARAAREAGVQHYVYTSVGSAHRNTGIPHFENKWRVERTVRSLGFPSHAVLRPVFFMENLLGGFFLQGDKVMAGLKPDTPLQMVAVKDIGRVEAQGFTRSAELSGKEFDLAGEAVTMADATKILSAALGKPLTFVSLPIEAVRQNNAEFAIMLQWFEDVGYSADIPLLDKTFGRMLRLEEWAKTAKAPG